MFRVDILRNICWFCAVDYTKNPRSAIIQDEELVPLPQPLMIEYVGVRKLG